MSETDIVVFEELQTVTYKKIGVARLNSERSLNALSLGMIERLMPQLLAWQENDNIAMVILEGAGEKAFCAGGDIVDIYNAMKEQPNEFAPKVEAFFATEYQLDYLIHTYGKPFIVWGSGIVMGGGLGLMSGGSHRIVTETSRIAMPEITIGLYPDVGGTWFLNRMPGNTGLFLGLTGASINAADARYVNLADHYIHSTDKANVKNALIAEKWDDSESLNHEKLTQLLAEFEQAQIHSLPASQVEPHQALIDELTASNNIVDVVNAITTYESPNIQDDKWFTRAQASLAQGSPITALIVGKQLELGKHMTLEQCFQFELGLSVQCGKLGEFAEGIRALLIEKDRQPKWLYDRVENVPSSVIDELMTSPWPEEHHPLASLGR